MAIGNRKSPATNNPRRTRFRAVFVSHIFSHVTPFSLKNDEGDDEWELDDEDGEYKGENRFEYVSTET